MHINSLLATLRWCTGFAHAAQGAATPLDSSAIQLCRTWQRMSSLCQPSSLHLQLSVVTLSKRGG